MQRNIILFDYMRCLRNKILSIRLFTFVLIVFSVIVLSSPLNASDWHLIVDNQGESLYLDHDSVLGQDFSVTAWIKHMAKKREVINGKRVAFKVMMIDVDKETRMLMFRQMFAYSSNGDVVSMNTQPIGPIAPAPDTVADLLVKAIFERYYGPKK